MYQRQEWTSLFGFVLISIFLVGCGNDAMVDPSGAVEVSGIVTLDGKPLNEAEVTFFPADDDPLVGPAITNADNKGKYTVSVNAPREYKVNIDRMLNGAPNPALKAYQGKETSLTAKVTKENTTFNFDLKKSN